MKGIENQVRLFAKLKADHGNKKFVDRMMDVLSISHAGVYRRVHGETLLTISEIVILSEEYNMSFNEMFFYKPKNEVVFKFNYNSDEQKFEGYINEITSSLDFVRSFEDHVIIYSAKDLPPWHYFECPFLRTFKIFYWLRSIKREKEFLNIKFNFDVIPEAFHNAAKNSLESFKKVNSEEIWTPSSLNIMLGQIGYYYESAIINEEQFNILTEKLNDLLDRLQSEIALGRKTSNVREIENVGTYKVFLSDIIGGDNVIYARGGTNQMLFHPPVLMNYIYTDDQDFCDYIKTSFEIAKGTAELISEISERRRNLFFNDFKNKVKILKRKYSVLGIY